jgi:uncharacterized protein (DUF1499 family)
MKKIYLLIVVLYLGLVLFLAILSIISREKPHTGLVGGRLRVCPDRPNYVCSEDKDLPSYIKPLSLSGPAKNEWERAKQVINEMGCKIIQEEDSYIWATFDTRIFRFIDDLELRINKENQVIHIRSGSRVGYSDMGVNRRRIEDFWARFDQSS